MSDDGAIAEIARLQAQVSALEEQLRAHQGEADKIANGLEEAPAEDVLARLTATIPVSREVFP